MDTVVNAIASLEDVMVFAVVVLGIGILVAVWIVVLCSTIRGRE